MLYVIRAKIDGLVWYLLPVASDPKAKDASTMEVAGHVWGRKDTPDRARKFVSPADAACVLDELLKDWDIDDPPPEVVPLVPLHPDAKQYEPVESRPCPAMT